ncbi:MAG TPA: amidohydrolase family protein, partial [Gemmatimonadaceae bacterium]|nr:amidohydrolase family protein [Gemmatimonadaceae bacterium]
MPRIRSASVVILGLLPLAPHASASQSPTAPPVQAIVNVTVIDGTGRPPIREGVMLVADGRIVAVGTRRSVSIPRGATRIDGAGGFLLPGFIDTHAHVTLGPVELDRSRTPPAMRALPDSQVTRRTLGALLAAGITSARDPGGPAAATVAVRDSVARGDLVGPRLVVAGEVIDQSDFPGLTGKATTPEQVRAEVRRQAAVGVDLIKLYATLTPPLVTAAVEEAHRLSLPVVGHLMFTSWTEGARAGMDGFVHIIGWSPKLLPPAARGGYLRMLGGTQFMYGWLEAMDLDAPELTEAIDAMAARRMHLDPTLVVFERAVHADDAAVHAHPHLGDAPDALVENWRTSFNFNIGWTADDYRRARAAFPKALQLTKRLYDKGVLLGAGTDANNPWTVAGESYHRELELLVAAGIPPMNVLTIATRNGARILGLERETGTLEAGKRADL